MYLDGIGPYRYCIALPDLGPFTAFRLAVELHQPLYHQALSFPTTAYHIGDFEQLDQGDEVLIGFQREINDNLFHE